MNRPKKKLSQSRRVARGLLSILDLRAIGHAFRLINYFNYTHVAPRRHIRAGRGLRLSPTASFANGSRIFIGDRVGIGAFCSIWAGDHSGTIAIGEDSLFGPEVFVTAANYSLDFRGPVTESPMVEADVRIGCNVFIGARAVILPGVEIGDNAVVGAGAVVAKSIPPNEIWAGNPARRIGRRPDGSGVVVSWSE